MTFKCNTFDDQGFELRPNQTKIKIAGADQTKLRGQFNTVRPDRADTVLH